MTNRQDCRFGRPQVARRVAHRDVRHQFQRLEQAVLGLAVLFGLSVHDGLPIALAVNVTKAIAGAARHGLAGATIESGYSLTLGRRDTTAAGQD